MSSSTSYYTNSPSPPHQPVAPQRASQDQPPLLDGLEPSILAQCFPHSTTIDTTHSETLVISRNQFELIAGKLDQLTRRVEQLETTLAGDVRSILRILGESRRPDEPSPSRPRVFQRSVSEPKPISGSHSQVLHRFASFNKAFDLQDPWVGEDEGDEAPEEEGSAPIARLESLDELDVESPKGSPRRK